MPSRYWPPFNPKPPVNDGLFGSEFTWKIAQVDGHGNLFDASNLKPLSKHGIFGYFFFPGYPEFPDRGDLDIKTYNWSFPYGGQYQVITNTIDGYVYDGLHSGSPSSYFNPLAPKKPDYGTSFNRDIIKYIYSSRFVATRVNHTIYTDDQLFDPTTGLNSFPLPEGWAGSCPYYSNDPDKSWNLSLDGGISSGLVTDYLSTLYDSQIDGTVKVGTADYPVPPPTADPANDPPASWNVLDNSLHITTLNSNDSLFWISGAATRGEFFIPFTYVPDPTVGFQADLTQIQISLQQARTCHRDSYTVGGSPSDPIPVLTNSSEFPVTYDRWHPPHLLFIYRYLNPSGEGDDTGGNPPNGGAKTGCDMLNTRTGLYIALGGGGIDVHKFKTAFQPYDVTTNVDNDTTADSPTLNKLVEAEGVCCFYRIGTFPLATDAVPNPENTFKWKTRSSWDGCATWKKRLDDDGNEITMLEKVKWARSAELGDGHRDRGTIFVYNDGSGKDKDGKPDGTGLLLADLYDVQGKKVGTYPEDGKGICGKKADDKMICLEYVNDRSHDIRVGFFSGGAFVYALTTNGKTWKDLTDQFK